MEAYCLKCREKINVVNEEISTTKNGLKILKGTCPKCSGKVAKILRK
jgi:Zn finger protein HypA/HybF involved in hydrogenase expression